MKRRTKGAGGGTQEMVSRELLLFFVLLGAAQLDVPPVALTVGHAPHRFSKILIRLLRGERRWYVCVAPRDFGPGSKGFSNDSTKRGGHAVHDVSCGCLYAGSPCRSERLRWIKIVTLPYPAANDRRLNNGHGMPCGTMRGSHGVVLVRDYRGCHL